MIRAIFALLICVLALPASATDHTPEHRILKNLGNAVSPFGEKGVYELTNIISLQSTFGLSTQRDVTVTTNGGTVGLDGGYLEVLADTQAGSTAALETVDRGQYQPGKGAEAGIGISVITPPTGDGLAEWGLGDGDNGAFWRLKASGLCIVYERAITETEVCDGSFNKEGLGEFDPTTSGAVYIVRFNWYGFGGADYWVYVPSTEGVGGLKARLVHRHVPANGQAMEDPNQYIFARVDNGTTTTANEIEVGGRRYDVQGKFKPPLRKTHHRRTGLSVGTSYVPVICARKEEPFPETGRQNSINAFLAAFVPSVASEDISVVFATVDANDLTGASFVDPPDYADGNSALEYDISATAITNYTVLAGAFQYAAGDSGNKAALGEDKQERIDLIRTDPTCVLAKTDANTATVDATLRVTEEW